MNKAKKTMCEAILLLNYVPRYGRTYSLEKISDLSELVNQKPEWVFFRYGFWGTNILDKCGLLWQYVEETDIDD